MTTDSRSAAETLDAIRARHQPDDGSNAYDFRNGPEYECITCRTGGWPCDAGLLLALLTPERIAAACETVTAEDGYPQSRVGTVNFAAALLAALEAALARP